MHDSTTSQSNIDPTSDIPQKSVVQAGGVFRHNYSEIDLTDPPEWFKKQAREMTNQEVHERHADINRIKNEAKEVLVEIPKLIKYLDTLYPSHPSTIKRFEEWVKRMEQDVK